MFEAEKGTPKRLEGCGLSIGIVQARFNQTITDALTLACKQQLLELGVEASDIDHVQVPGALEIPVALQVMAESDLHDALIAIGCIVRGETYHFELVANESAAGVNPVALDHTIAVVNAILTTENTEQAQARQTEKGRDAALVAVEMAHLIAWLSQR